MQFVSDIQMAELLEAMFEIAVSVVPVQLIGIIIAFLAGIFLLRKFVSAAWHFWKTFVELVSVIFIFYILEVEALETAFSGIVTDITDFVTGLIPVLGPLLGLFVAITVGVRLIRRFTKA